MASNGSAPLSSTSYCVNCKNTTSRLRKCSACSLVSFCGETCQKAYWPCHKRGCKIIQKANKSGGAPIDGEGNTVLMAAAIVGDPGLIASAAHNSIAEIDARRSSDGATALLLAVKHNQVHALRCLLLLGADPTLSISAEKGWEWPKTNCKGNPHCRLREDGVPCRLCPPQLLRECRFANPLMVACHGKVPSAGQDRGDEVVRLLYFGRSQRHTDGTAELNDELAADELRVWVLLFLENEEMRLIEGIAEIAELTQATSNEEAAGDALGEELNRRGSALLGYDMLRQQLRFSSEADIEESDRHIEACEQSILEIVRRRHPEWKGYEDEDGESLAFVSQMLYTLAVEPKECLQRIQGTLQQAVASKSSGVAHLVQVATFIATDFGKTPEPLKKVKRRAEKCMAALANFGGKGDPDDKKVSHVKDYSKGMFKAASCASEVVDVLRNYMIGLSCTSLGMIAPTDDPEFDAYLKETIAKLPEGFRSILSTAKNHKDLEEIIAKIQKWLSTEGEAAMEEYDREHGVDDSEGRRRRAAEVARNEK